jgi:hypothetical protein
VRDLHRNELFNFFSLHIDRLDPVAVFGLGLHHHLLLRLHDCHRAAGVRRKVVDVRLASVTLSLQHAKDVQRSTGTARHSQRAHQGNTGPVT